MRTGRLVRRHLAAILDHCRRVDPGDLARLQEPRWSKLTFDVNFPVLAPVAGLPQALARRYWPEVHELQGRRLRVLGQWYDPPTSRSLMLVEDWLALRGLLGAGDLPARLPEPGR
ncbi:hypothetical protein V8J36_13490 [Frigidibacter sp. MR17.14]|uniref:hypothetical protein n=1 Tax=Frigidibacter sp. MR17.14 TaxID=3126509 RepID=UPI003012D7A8